MNGLSLELLLSHTWLRRSSRLRPFILLFTCRASGVQCLSSPHASLLSGSSIRQACTLHCCEKPYFVPAEHLEWHYKWLQGIGRKTSGFLPNPYKLSCCSLESRREIEQKKYCCHTLDWIWFSFYFQIQNVIEVKCCNCCRLSLYNSMLHLLGGGSQK